MATTPSPLNEMKVKWLTLSFPGNLEKAFLEDYFRKSLRHVRIALLIAIFFYGIFGILDAWLVPGVKQTLWLIRYAIFLPLVSATLLFSFSRHFKRYMQASIATVVLVAGLGIIAMILIAPYPGNYSYYAGLILVFIYGYTFFKLRFIWATLAGWTIVIAYEIAALWFSHTPIPILINNNFFFLSGNIIGMFACYSIELYSRRDFMRARLLEAEREKVNTANLELEKRVEERTRQLTKSNRELRQEIEDRKQAEKALQESEQRFRCLSENSPDIIYTLGRDGAYTYVNPAWENILGYKIEEVIGKYFVDFARKEDAKYYVRLFKRIRDGKETIRDALGTLIHKNGSERLFNLSGAPNLNLEGEVTGMVGLLKDITEQQSLQAQLLQAQKMEAIGTLAGGVAHDFNNMLQAVQGYSDLLLLRRRKDEPGYQELLHIRGASQRASELTQQLLTFSRKVESKLRPINLNHQVKQVHMLLDRTIPKMIGIKLHLAEDLSTINADPAQIEQVIMNLAVNARDAMPDGGRLIIETENVTLDEEYCRANLEATPGDYVLLRISDTGHGMEQEILEHIFEPFYTTKEIGKGTGLGLAIVYGIIKKHRGHIASFSSPANGSTFNVYLPVIMQEIESEDVKEEEMPIGGHETILIVDDEEPLRELWDQVLSEFGYAVLTAPDARSTLELYRNEYHHIDLIILDLIMPEMSGMVCLEEMLKINPQAKIIVASGYPINASEREAVETKARGFIKKPYDLHKMLEAIREALDQQLT